MLVEVINKMQLASSSIDSSCVHMISICGSLFKVNKWDLEILYLPKNLDPESVLFMGGVYFTHPGIIPELDVALLYDRESFYSNGEQVTLT